MTDISRFRALIKANKEETPLRPMPLSPDRQEALNRHIQSQDKELSGYNGVTPTTK